MGQSASFLLSRDSLVSSSIHNHKFCLILYLNPLKPQKATMSIEGCISIIDPNNNQSGK